MKKFLRFLFVISLLFVVGSLSVANVSASRRTAKPAQARSYRVVPRTLRGTWFNATKNGRYNVLRFVRNGFYSSGYSGHHRYTVFSSLHVENPHRDPSQAELKRTRDWFVADPAQYHGHKWFCISGYYGCGGCEYYVNGRRHELVETSGAGFYPEANYYRSKRLAKQNRK